MAKIPPADTPIIDRQSGRISLEWYTALQRLVNEITAIGGGGVVTFEGRNGAVVSANGDYTASEITNVAAGNISSVTVQAALNELDTEKALTARQIISGGGLTGGGDLSADRTLAVGAGTGITVNADDVALDTTSTRNTDHAGVTLTAGAGLTGGGDITASRSFAVGAGTAITVNADDVAVTAGGIGTTQLANDGVTMAKIEDAEAYTILLRNAGTTGDPDFVKISALTNSSAFGSGDKIMIEEATGELRKVDFDDLPGGGPANLWTTVKKTTDETTNTDATLSDDSALVVPLAAATNYVIRGTVFYDTPTAADFKFSFNGPASPSLVNIAFNFIDTDGSAGEDSNEAYGVSVSITGLAGTFGLVKFTALIRNGANVGNFTFQWAQNTSNGSNTTVRAGSYLEYFTP